VKTLQARNALSIDAQIQKAQAAGDTATVAALMQKKANDIAVANGTKTYPTNTSCAGMVDFFKSPFVCGGRMVASILSSILISVAAWALAIAGVLFNWTLMNTVILFKDVIFGPIENGINIGWTAFRDISNIVIIGVFTFIAISIILGNKEFGQKKLVARVLVIAILINFSLLFTQLIIDASNFTAGQFYAATQTDKQTLSQVIDAEKSGTSPSGASGVNVFSGYANKGIAGQFVNFLGITSIADTYSALTTAADQNDSMWIMLVHALFAMILLLGAAIVLFYGSFLLISRAVLLIFLLLTSAIAFASHLIPKMSDGNYGWKAWWQSLLGSAVLAPLLMIFLYITLQIASSLKATSGTLGELISGNAKGGDINALFSYLLILGLLYGSFKLASQFSAKIGGFNFAQMASVVPLALASRFAVAPIARNLFGRDAARRGMALDTDIEAERLKAAQAKASGRPYDYNKLYDLTKKKARAETLAKSDYNVMNTAGGKSLTHALGIPGFISGEKKVGGFAAGAEQTAKEAAKRAGQLELSPAQVQAVRESAQLDAKQRGTVEMNLLETRKQTAEKEKKNAELQMKNIVGGKQRAEGAIRKEEKTMSDIKTKHETILKTIAEEIARSAPADKPGIEQKHAAARGARDEEIAAQQVRINNAQKDVKSMPAYQTLESEAKALEKTISDADAAIKDINKEIEKVPETVGRHANRETEWVTQSHSDEVADVAERMAHRRLTNLPLVAFGEKAKNDYTAQLARKMFGKERKAKRIKENLLIPLQQMQEEAEGGGGATPPPAAPPPAGGTH
ncbi:MAG: hypothetical protein Q7S05_04110, partial [bacterium]|nr:hypothetical protein [bacterium]